MKAWETALLVALISGSALCFALALACGDDDDDDDENEIDGGVIDDDVNDDTSDDDTVDDDDTSDDDVPCDSSKTPIIYVHGMIDAGSTFANSAMRFASNGYCPDRIFAFDWNTVGINYTEQLRDLTAFIDDVLERTGESKIDLVGHSAGGGLSKSYLDIPENAAKILHYGNIASFGANSLPGGVPTINISSEDDHVAGSSEITGAENVYLEGTDHLQVVTSPESFESLYRFFNDGQVAATTDILPEEKIELSGRVVSLGENTPGAGYDVRIYETDTATGQRVSQTPVASFTADQGGYFGPFTAESDAGYEFEAIPTDPDIVPVHYFREPFIRSCNLVYIRSFPSPLSMTGLLLSSIPFGDDHTVLVSFTANQSIIAGRDSLIVDGYEMATDQMAAPQDSTIAIFFFDDNGNGQTDAAPVGGLFGSFPFLQGFDMMIPSATSQSITLNFNARTVRVPNLKSKSDGAVIAWFD